MNLKIGARTDKGCKRSLNEDSIYCDKAMGLFVLADGMGGHRAGEVASGMAIETMVENIKELLFNDDLSIMGEYREEFSRETNKLASSIRLASFAIYETAQKRSEYNGMGSTVVSVLLSGSVMSTACVGDSRIYLIRDKVLKQLTTDHSLVVERLKRGIINEKEARESRLKNVITRALGMNDSVEVDLDEQVILKRDCILMCSDGLYDMVEDDEILHAVLSYPKEPQKVCDCLVGLANEYGGNDNISVILLYF